MQPEGVSIGAVELGVHAEERLDPIIAGRNVREARYWVAERGAVDHGHRAGREGAHVHAEEGRAVALVMHLETGLLVVAAGHEDIRAAGDRCVAELGPHADLEARPLRGKRGDGHGGRYGQVAESHGRSEAKSPIV